MRALPQAAQPATNAATATTAIQREAPRATSAYAAAQDVSASSPETP